MKSWTRGSDDSGPLVPFTGEPLDPAARRIAELLSTRVAASKEMQALLETGDREGARGLAIIGFERRWFTERTPDCSTCANRMKMRRRRIRERWLELAPLRLVSEFRAASSEEHPRLVEALARVAVRATCSWTSTVERSRSYYRVRAQGKFQQCFQLRNARLFKPSELRCPLQLARRRPSGRCRCRCPGLGPVSPP